MDDTQSPPSSPHSNGASSGHNGTPDVVVETSPDRLAEPLNVAGERPRLPFTVVGVGASAGGLEAYSEFLQSCEAGAGIAYVLIQHLSPKHESLLAELLQKHTMMPVLQVEDGMKVKPDHVYVIRPGFTLTIFEGRLHLGESAAESMHRRPVDDFFKSLAEEQRERAVAVILSGTGSNGTLGCESVKTVGGFVIAEDPQTAKFPSMPRSLIESNLADAVLRPSEMFPAIRSYAAHPYAAGVGQSSELLVLHERRAMNDVLAVLRSCTRHDFSVYKKPTLVRRIQRRMSLLQIDTMADYVRALRQTPTEVVALADDLMIHVTGFFRDADVWDSLRKRVIDPMVAAKEDGGTVRVWVTACSSGEEAYTIGILLLEASDVVNKCFDIKIFATDTAERSLGQARAGIFPGGIESEITPDRLARFFDKDDAHYRVKKELRELVIFAPQNVLQDPPFSKLDLCTCRNLLIYIEGEVQRRILQMLHLGLRDNGTLLLGNSETITGAEDLFEPIDKPHRIYRRIGPTRHGALDFPIPHVPTTRRMAARSVHGDGDGNENGNGDGDQRSALPRATVSQLAMRTLLDQHTPAAVVVDRGGQIIYYHGNTSLFTNQPSGEPTRELLTLVREEFRGAVRAALQKSMTENQLARHRDGFVGDGPERQRIEISAAPLGGAAGTNCFLVSFRSYPDPPLTLDATGTDDARVNEELSRVRDELQSTIEELQTSNEEMKASHEEVTSINEELQSTNEELETSKEELQSLNEELTTVNAQLQAKMEELERTGNDLSSLLSSTEIAVIFLDMQFRIRRFTPPARALIDLIASDAGRPLKDLAWKFDDADLMADAAHVLERLVPVEREMSGHDGRHYVRRALPYRTADNRIGGVVLTFIDITERRRAETALRESEKLRRIALDSGRLGAWSWDTAHDRIQGDALFMELYGYPPSKKAFPLSHFTARMGPEAAAACEAVAARELDPGEEFEGDLELAIGPTAGRWVRWRGRADRDVPGVIYGVSFDVTEQRRAEAASRANEEKYAALFGASPAAFLVVQPNAPRFTITEVNDAYLAATMRTRESVVGRGMFEAFPDNPEDAASSSTTTLSASMQRVLATGQPDRLPGLKYDIVRPDGTFEERWWSLVNSPVLDQNGQVQAIIHNASDVTEEYRATAALRTSEARLRRVFESNVVGMIRWDLQRSLIVDANDTFLRMTGYTRDDVASGRLNFREMTPPEWLARNEQAIRAIRDKGHAPPFEKEYFRKDGSRLPLIIAGTRFDDSPTEGMSLLIDISDRKQAEIDHATLLEAEQHARTTAEAVNTTKDLFLANLSHELRTPLSAMLMWSNLLQAEPDADTLTEGLSAIQRSAEAQKLLIDDLLDSARIATGKLKLELRPVDLGKVVRDAAAALRPTADAKDVKLRVVIGKLIGFVMADADRLQQVLWNLINNALKFTPAGGRVDVNLQRHDGTIDIRVSDTGQGIDPEFLPHLFGRFSQGDPSRTRRFGGLGLGLSISRQIVELHGGTIRADSGGLGEGSTFTVELPLPRTKRTEAPAKAGNELAGVRITLVEDDEQLREVVTMLLQRAGATVEGFATADPAKAAVLENPPDLLLSDIGMPDKDGYAMIREIRDREPADARVPAIAFTAFDRVKDRSLAIERGFDDHLVKPVDPAKLIQAIRKLLGL